jgi:hypothetical protein
MGEVAPGFPGTCIHTVPVSCREGKCDGTGEDKTWAAMTWERVGLDSTLTLGKAGASLPSPNGRGDRETRQKMDSETYERS